MLEVDRNKAKAQGVSLSDIFVTLQANLGSLYINDFNKFARTYRVIMESEYRRSPEDLSNFYVRNQEGDMVPLLTLAKLTPMQVPTSMGHFNLYRAAKLTGDAAPGQLR